MPSSAPAAAASVTVAATAGIVGASAIAVFFPCYIAPVADAHGLLIPVNVLPPTLSTLDGAIHADAYRSALVMSCVVAIPMAADVVLDGVKVSQQTWEERVHLTVRGVLLVAMTLPNLAMLYDTNNSDSDVYLFIAVDKFMKVVATCGALVYVAVDHHGVGLGLWCAATAFLVGLSQCFVVATQLAAHGHDAFVVLALGCEVGAAMVGIVCVAKWLISWRRAGRRASADDVCYAMYFLAVVVFVLGHVVVSANYGNVDPFAYGDASPACLSAYVYVRMAYLVVVMKVPGRVARFSSERAVALVKDRQTLIRYISHEIRGPLGAVAMGASYLAMELKERLGWSDVSDEEREFLDGVAECVDDIGRSCDDATGIVSDILDFDKIGEGKMTLEVAKVPLAAFVADVLKPFDTAVKEKGLALCVVYDSENGQSAWAQHMEIFVDRAKIAQVLRNFLTNAIKFTPAGGNVTVTLTRLRESQNPPAEPGGSQRSFGSLQHHLRKAVRKVHSTITAPTGRPGVPPIPALFEVYRSRPGSHCAEHPRSLPGIVMAGIRSAEQAAAVAPAPSPVADMDTLILAHHRRSMEELRRLGGSGPGPAAPPAAAPVAPAVGGARVMPRGIDESEQKPAKTYLRIDVTDTGAGISPENITKLFGQYVQFRAAELQKGGGSGLGLWISKSIMDMHGGRIGATSDGEGRGSTFYVIVPLYPAVAAPAKATGRSFDAAVDAASHASLDQGRAASPVVGGRGLQQ